MSFLQDPEIDPATADLAVELQLGDVAVYFESSKGKSTMLTDEELAFQFQQQDLEHTPQFHRDHRMARSLAVAVQADGQIVANNRSEEENATKDRDTALRWAEDELPQEVSQSPKVHTSLDDETLAKLEILYVSGDHHSYGIEETKHAESSACAAQRAFQSPPSQLRRCVACREETAFVHVARVPCGHEYCRSCLQDLFETALRDESLFPPRCCRQPLVMSVARIFLPSDLVERYKKKKVEFETPNRTYCHSSQCSIFIHPSQIDSEVATCSACGCTTCTNCKGRAHTGDCPNDTPMQQLLETAQDQGWQRCYSCWRLVELDHGCNHMTCRCGAQFCYNCGERWKTCQCEQWDEHRLLDRAYQIIDRDEDHAVVHAPFPDAEDPARELNEAPAEIPEPEADDESPVIPETLEAMQDRSRAGAQTAREDLVARAVQELRDNHECDHEQWAYVPRPHVCEECSDYLRVYIFECRRCRLRACNRCRRNRL